MTKTDERTLMDAIRDAIAELQERGKYGPRNVAELTAERNPELVREVADKLALDRLTEMSRKAMSRSTPAVGHAQMILPFELRRLDLPHSINYPARAGSEEDHVWVALHKATRREIRLYLEMLALSIARDEGRLKNVQELDEYLSRHMDEDQLDEPIGPVLEELAAEEQKPARVA